MPGYTTVDVGYTLKFDPWRATLSVDNLFDRDHEQFIGFPAQGRRLRATLRASF